MTTSNFLLAIGGIFLTIIFGVLSIRYALKSRNKIKLSFIVEDCISLFRSIVQNMEGIEIFFEKKPIRSSLVMLKGCLLNTGNTDIDDSMIHQPVRILLPKGLEWKRIQITGKASKMKVEHSILNKTTLEFKWDLMKKKEFIKFDSLIDAAESDTKHKEDEDKEKSIFKAIVFSHRITNLDEIQKIAKEKIVAISTGLFIGYVVLQIILIFTIYYINFVFSPGFMLGPFLVSLAVFLPLIIMSGYFEARYIKARRLNKILKIN